MVLGAPVEFPNTFNLYRKAAVDEVVADLKKATHLLTQLGDPQVEHTLLRYCLDACRLQHLLRSMNCSQLRSTLAEASQATMVGKPLSDTEWIQCKISISRGGLGIRDPSQFFPSRGQRPFPNS